VLIYICHKRTDSRALTGRIHAHLGHVLGASHVHMDASESESADLAEPELAALSACSIGVLIIGPNWSAPIPEGASDVAAHELQVLCDRGVPVVPVLVDGAAVPAPGFLPPSIANRLEREAVLIRADRDFPYGLEQLLHSIDIASGQGPHSRPAYGVPSSHPPRSRSDASSYAPHTVAEDEPKQGSRALWLSAAFGALGVVAAIALAVTHTDAPSAATKAPTFVERPRVASAPGQATSTTGCISPWGNRCAGGGCSGLIGDSEQFELHLASLYVSDGSDPCGERTVRDLWLCQGATCLSQRDACTRSQSSSRAYTTASFRVTGAQLESGLELTVREGGPQGVVLSQLRPTYADPLLKQPFLCWGGVYGRQALGPAPGPIVKLTYYLEPR
jgi:hypothetical protein